MFQVKILMKKIYNFSSSNLISKFKTHSNHSSCLIMKLFQLLEKLFDAFDIIDAFIHCKMLLLIVVCFVLSYRDIKVNNILIFWCFKLLHTSNVAICCILKIELHSNYFSCQIKLFVMQAHIRHAHIDDQVKIVVCRRNIRQWSN